MWFEVEVLSQGAPNPAYGHIASPETDIRFSGDSLLVLVRRQNRRLIVISQTDHAHLSAELASRWGNDVFDAPMPFAEMVSAAAGHDDGWTYNDEMPALNGRGRPADLFADGTGASLRIHKDTADTGRKRAPYAALLISMHRTGLTQDRYRIGWSARSDPKKTSNRTDPKVREWVIGEERWQKEVRTGSDLPFADRIHLWSNYKLLQVWDRMSLYLCYLDRDNAKNATIFPVPTKYGKRDVKITVRPARSGGVIVDPWPFTGDSIRVTIGTRVIRDTRYASPFDAARELLAAAPRTVTFHLTGTPTRAR